MKRFILACFISTIMATVAVSASGDRRNPVYVNPAGKEFPVLAWYSMPDSAQTGDRYKELRRAGFNLSYSQLADESQIEKALNAAKGSGVKVIVGSNRFERATEATVNRFRNHPSVGGWFLRDEPTTSDFKSLRSFRDRIYEADTTHLTYLNLLPDLLPASELGADSYEDYVGRFIDEVSLPMVSFDFYPVVTVDGVTAVRGNFYDNLEKIRKICKEKKLPFWAFCLSTAHGVYPVATDTHLRFEAFSALAHGAQAIQYFTYWQPDTSVWDFHHAPIDSNGRRTEVYSRVASLNKEIQSLAKIFLGMEVISVGHTGKNIPDGTERFDSFPEEFSNVEADGEGLLVSYFRNGKDRYMLLLNRDISNPQRVNMTKFGKVRKVNRSGKLKKSGSSVETIAPGDYLLFKLN